MAGALREWLGGVMWLLLPYALLLQLWSAKRRLVLRYSRSRQLSGM